MMPDLLFYALALLPSAVLAFALKQARERAETAERETRTTKANNDALQRANSCEVSRRLETLYHNESKGTRGPGA